MAQDSWLPTSGFLMAYRRSLCDAAGLPALSGAQGESWPPKAGWAALNPGASAALGQVGSQGRPMACPHDSGTVTAIDTVPSCHGYGFGADNGPLLERQNVKTVLNVGGRLPSAPHARSLLRHDRAERLSWPPRRQTQKSAS